MKTIGFIGMGLMGSRMAANLLAAGFSVHVYDRTPAKSQSLEEKGAVVEKDIPALAKNVEIVMSMLANDAAVEDVYFSAQGVFSSLKEGATIIDSSSIRPETSQKLYKAAQEKGIAMIDAPVSGSLPQVEEKSLVFYVGGDKDVFEACIPVFQTLGKSWNYFGESGSGTAMKLAVNSALATEMVALTEAVAFGVALGLAKEQVIDVLAHTTVIPPALKMKLENMKKNSYPTSFPLKHMTKDVVNALLEAQRHSANFPVLETVKRTYELADAQTPDEDFSSVAKVTLKK